MEKFKNLSPTIKGYLKLHFIKPLKELGFEPCGFFSLKEKKSVIFTLKFTIPPWGYSQVSQINTLNSKAWDYTTGVQPPTWRMDDGILYLTIPYPN